MGMTPEGRVKAAVKKLLAQFEPAVYAFMPVQAGYGQPGLDFHCHINGFAFYIETKAPGKRPTPRQELTIREIKAAGAPVFIIDGASELHLAELQAFLDLCQICNPATAYILSARS